MGKLAGVCTGIIVGLILVAVILKITKTDGSMKCKFDERQVIARGKGYKYGFFTCAVCNIIYAFGAALLPKLPIDPSAFMILTIAIGACVHISYCIWNDAYFSLNENRGRLMITFVLIAALNLYLGISSLLDGRGLKDGVLNLDSVNLFAGMIFIVAFLVMAAKHVSDRAKDKE